MSDPERLAGWLAVLLFVAGGLLAFCRLRDWYLRRGIPRPDKKEEWPQTRFSLRRFK